MFSFEPWETYGHQETYLDPGVVLVLISDVLNIKPQFGQIVIFL